MLAGVSDGQIANMTPFAWLKTTPVAPKADHIRELLECLRRRTRYSHPPGRCH